MSNIRKLRQDEINEARKVFGDTINYQSVYIQEYGEGAMTWVYTDERSFNTFYIIFWSKAVFDVGAITAGRARTLIHELTHVWQGHCGTYAREYMINSGAAQTDGVVFGAWEKGIRELTKRLWNQGPRDTWHSYRSRAYAFNLDDIGVKNWSYFNVEQQASIVESWYSPDSKPDYFGVEIPGGNMSTSDPRYPYITCNILARSPSAKYVPLKVPAQVASPPLGRGADAKIKAIQDILVSLRYLDPKYANGYMGQHTHEAVKGFQRNNGLKPDGDIGGANSLTRIKLGVR